MTTERQIEASKNQLNLVLSFFARVDSKLSVILALDTGMLAVLATNMPPMNDLSLTMGIAGCLTLVLIAASIGFLYRGAFPHLKGGEASLIYFREIAKLTEHNFIENFKKLSEDQYVNDLLAQVWRNSEILKMKFDAMKIAFVIVALAIIPWILSLILFAEYHSLHGLGPFK